MTKASHVLSSICLLVLSLMLYSPVTVQGQSQAQQVVNDAADALGGRDRVLAVKTLLVEGEGKEFSFGQGSSWTEMGQEASVWKVMGYRRAYDLTASRARFEQSRTALYAFFAGHIPGKSVMRAFVIKRHARDAREYRYQFEVQVGDKLQSLAPVSTHCGLTAEYSRWLTNKLPDHR